MIRPIDRSAHRMAAAVLFGLAATPMAAADILFTDFSSAAGLNLVGDAATTGDVLRLIPSQGWQNGAAWYADPQSIAGGFETQFRFRIHQSSALGADGFTFTLQGMSPSAIGAPGGMMGYSSNYGPGGVICGTPNGITHSLVVEFDTYTNSDLGDPNDNHISVHTRGAEPNCASHVHSLGETTAIPNLSDSAVHTALIRYSPGQLEVFVDDLLVPALSVPLDLNSYPALPTGWVGFTSASGSSYENYDILDWTFTEDASGGTVTYCTSTANSTGLPAGLFVGGSLSVLQNDLTLTVTRCPTQTFGLFIYGADAVRFPLGDGFLCVSPFAPGLFRLNPVHSTDVNGEANMAVDLQTLSGAGAIHAGSTWHFQFWFRDGMPGGAGSNLSSAVRVNFQA
ncbi:MAG: hypothetical protein ACI80K_000293 [Paracoccaceae bacterium]|jgi:hypothetical protein